MISTKDVEHVAKLARLGLSEEEVEKFGPQLVNIFGYIDMLNEVDVENVELTSQVTGLESVTRKDEVTKFCTKEELLACTELPVEREQIKVKSVITES